MSLLRARPIVVRPSRESGYRVACGSGSSSVGSLRTSNAHFSPSAPGASSAKDRSFSAERRTKVPLKEPGSSRTRTAPSSHQSVACCDDTSASESWSEHDWCRPMVSGVSRECVPRTIRAQCPMAAPAVPQSQ
eukprot:scaffold45929_cov26-Tisochrysis_lutea.AAC.4